MNFISHRISNITHSIIPPMNENYVDWPLKDPPSYTPYWFEIVPDVYQSRKFFWDNWMISIYISLVYMAMIYIGTQWMKNRKPYNLRGPLAVWNFSLGIFSILALVRTIRDFVDVLSSPNGFHRSVCIRDNLNPPSVFYAELFVLSKIIELGDTAFLVIRKRPIIFLHWYHHVTTLIVCWISYPQAEPVFRYVGTMNLFVHSLMYTYYGFRALQVKIPRSVSMTITILQLSQMAVGLLVNLYGLAVLNRGEECARTYANIRVQLWIYASYFILFMNYFYKAYFANPKSLNVKKVE